MIETLSIIITIISTVFAVGISILNIVNEKRRDNELMKVILKNMKKYNIEKKYYEKYTIENYKDKIMEDKLIELVYKDIIKNEQLYRNKNINNTKSIKNRIFSNILNIIKNTT